MLTKLFQSVTKNCAQISWSIPLPSGPVLYKILQLDSTHTLRIKKVTINDQLRDQLVGVLWCEHFDDAFKIVCSVSTTMREFKWALHECSLAIAASCTGIRHLFICNDVLVYSIDEIGMTNAMQSWPPIIAEHCCGPWIKSKPVTYCSHERVAASFVGMCRWEDSHGSGITYWRFIDNKILQ